MSQTIVALATPFGRSGIGVIRLSGEKSLEIAGKLIQNENFSPQPRYASLKKIFDPENSELIDQAVFTYFKAPHSFTGEDVIEISCHGSPVLLRQVIDFCLNFGARLARGGEFSLRALANGQINLSQAEAIRDLIESQTTASARQAVRQLRGELSNQLQPLKDNLLDVIVVLESSIEFVEDDLPDFQIENIKEKLFDVKDGIGKMALTFRAGKLLREGLKVVLAGRPNVGKSSLFNCLLGQERAIVTEIAGTTRDSINETLNIKGVPVSLTDTAGLRDTSETVESIGVNRAKQLMVDSDLVVVVLDNSQDLTEEDRKVLDEVKPLNYLVAVNKVDLDNSFRDLSEFYQPEKVVRISAQNATGLNELQDSIIQPFLPQDFNDSGFLVTDARHFDLLNRAKVEIENSLELIYSQMNEEIVLIGLYNALNFLGEITGETTSEDMLTRVFSTFCIGK